MRNLIDAIQAQPSPPCDNGCAFRSYCAARNVACKTFAVYVLKGVSVPSLHGDLPFLSPVHKLMRTEDRV